MESFKPIDLSNRQSLQEIAQNIIRDMIIEGALVPGEKIPEDQLSAKLSISRTPLREALKVLSAEGLVELKPNKGTYVAMLDDETVQYLLEVLAGLEAIAVDLACQRADEKDIEQFNKLHQKMEQAYEKNDKLSYFKLNLKLHDTLLQSARNPELYSIHQRIISRLYQVRYTSSQTSEGWHEGMVEHREMLTYFNDRNAIKLRRLMREHFQHTWTKYLTSHKKKTKALRFYRTILNLNKTA